MVRMVGNNRRWYEIVWEGLQWYEVAWDGLRWFAIIREGDVVGDAMRWYLIDDIKLQNNIFGIPGFCLNHLYSQQHHR